MDANKTTGWGRLGPRPTEPHGPLKKVTSSHSRKVPRNDAGRRERREAAAQKRAVWNAPGNLRLWDQHPSWACFVPRGGPILFWTTEPEDGFYLSGVAVDEEYPEPVPGSVQTHKLRREAKARAAALEQGWRLGKGRRVFGRGTP